MRSCFRELGLSEHATKAQVEEAYARRVARYKGPDYAEEPEYVHRKLTALRAAYEEARQIARTGDDSGYKPVVREEERRNTLKPVKKKAKTFDADYGDDEHAFSEKFHQWLEKRDDNKARKSNKSAKKDRKKKKGGMIEDLKNIDAEKLKSAWKEFKSDALGLGHTPLVPEEEEDVDVETFDFLRDDDDDDDYVFTDSGQRLGESGTVVSEPKAEKKSGGAELVSVIATLLIAGMTLFGSCGDDSVSYEDEYDYIDEYGVEYVYDYADNYDTLTDLDGRVKDLAEGAREELYMAEQHGSATWWIDEEETLRPYADEFAQNYWMMDSIEEVTNHLAEVYYDYPADSSMTLDQQLNYIFAFYGFMEVDDAQFFENPYHGNRMKCFSDYLDYLNQYAEEMK